MCYGLICVITEKTPLLLGSASPRRRALLEHLRIPLTVREGWVHESTLPGEGADAYLERIVEAKLQAVAAGLEGAAFGALLVADTVVVLDQEILGKPCSVADACAMVSRLVGRSHLVLTRYALAGPARLGRSVRARTIASQVFMRRASEAEVARYAASGEGLDKAGAYAVQGLGSFLVERIEGSYTNVVGLPVCQVVEDLLAVPLLEAFP